MKYRILRSFSEVITLQWFHHKMNVENRMCKFNCGNPCSSFHCFLFSNTTPSCGNVRLSNITPSLITPSFIIHHSLFIILSTLYLNLYPTNPFVITSTIISLIHKCTLSQLYHQIHRLILILPITPHCNSFWSPIIRSPCFA